MKLTHCNVAALAWTAFAFWLASKLGRYLRYRAEADR